MKPIWFAVDCNVHTNPKTNRLADMLKLDVDTTVGKLSRLWAWAKSTNNETGDISFLPDQEIADLMRWKKKPSILISALTECGFLDVGNGSKVIHGWTELNGDLCTKRRKDKERKN